MIQRLDPERVVLGCVGYKFVADIAKLIFLVSK